MEICSQCTVSERQPGPAAHSPREAFAQYSSPAGTQWWCCMAPLVQAGLGLALSLCTAASRGTRVETAGLLHT